MTPTPLASLQAGAARTARVVVEWRSTLILYMCVKVVEALGQLGKHWGSFSGAFRLELSTQHRGVQLVNRCLPERKRYEYVQVPLRLNHAFEYCSIITYHRL